jgi:hypothetical protein
MGKRLIWKGEYATYEYEAKRLQPIFEDYRSSNIIDRNLFILSIFVSWIPPINVLGILFILSYILTNTKKVFELFDQKLPYKDCGLINKSYKECYLLSPEEVRNYYKKETKRKRDLNWLIGFFRKNKNKFLANRFLNITMDDTIMAERLLRKHIKYNKYYFETYFNYAVTQGYLFSMRQAVLTEYPQGIVYILKNILQHLQLFGIDRYLPSDIVPNTAVLKEAVHMAQTLSQEWEKLNSVEKSQALANIRQKIEPEIKTVEIIDEDIKDMVIENKYNYEIYQYSYDFDDYQAELKQSSRQLPLSDISIGFPSSTTTSNSTKVLTFSDWVKQNPALEHFSEAQQQKAYQKYLAGKGIKQQISFEEYLSQNPALEFFSPEEQQEAYQKYLQENN